MRPAPSCSATRATRCGTCTRRSRSGSSPRSRCPANSARTTATTRSRRCATVARAVCVATDVAARGIDLPSLGLVIHADLPNDAESLQHRSGRTGRAGRKGVSVLLVPPFRRRRTEDLMRALGITPAWSGPPTADDIRKLDHERMLRDPSARPTKQARTMPPPPARCSPRTRPSIWPRHWCASIAPVCLHRRR